MTIDEAIVSLRKSASKSLDYEWQREQYQIAEWLEELKVYHQHEVICHKGYNAGYNKAIDDLRNELKNHYTEYNIDCVLEDNDFYSYTTACNYLEDYIDEIAEQLKAGGENEQGI